MNFEASIKSDTDILDPDGAKTRRGRKIIVIGLLLALAAIAGAYYFWSGSKPSTAGAAETDKANQAQTVTVVAPGQSTISRMITATGSLAARREVPVGVVGEGGQVSQVFVDAGDWVQQGQVLVSIERSVQAQQIIGQEAQINAARADLRLAQSELDRALQLVDRGFISKADIDRKTATRDSARARLGIADAQLRELRARTARLDIRAPVGGYILERKVEPGQTVTQGSGVLFRMAKGGELELQAQVGEADLASLSVGVPATVTPVGTDQKFSGQIWQLSPTINEQSRQGIARIALPFDRALKPGGFASVEIMAGAMTAAVLPESAIQNDSNGTYVYIVGANNKVQRRAIKTGIVTSNGIAVTEGLDGTERIVLYAGGFLNPDETVKPKLAKTASQTENQGAAK